MPSLKELHEMRGEAVAEVQRIADVQTADDFVETDESRSEWDQANAAISEIDRKIEVAKRAADLAAKQVENREERKEQHEQRAGRENVIPQRSFEEREEREGLALRGWLANQMDADVKPEWREAAEELGMDLNARQLGFDLRRDSNPIQRASSDNEIRTIANARENRAQSATVGALGGYLVPPASMAAAFEVAMLFYGGMMDVAEVIRTDSGVPFEWPGVNDTGNSGRQIGENAAVTVTDFVPSKDTWGAYKFTSDEVKVPYELLEDSAFDIPSIVGSMLGERIGRILNTKFTTGTGTATPYGIVNAATAGVTTASATAIKYDEVIDLIYSIDRAYRNASCSFMCNDDIVKYLRKLKDGTGNYLWTKATGPGEPDMIDQYPLVINNDMTGDTSGALVTATTTLLFGQLNKYKIRMVRGVRSYRLTERHRESDQDAFVSFVRADGGLLNAGGNPVKYLIQA